VLCSRILPQGDTPLKGRKVTCFHSIKDDVTNAGGTYVDREVCIDGNIITSRTPEDLPAFVVALMELMGQE
jgi:protease I